MYPYYPQHAFTNGHVHMSTLPGEHFICVVSNFVCAIYQLYFTLIPPPPPSNILAILSLLITPQCCHYLSHRLALVLKWVFNSKNKVWIIGDIKRHKDALACGCDLFPVSVSDSGYGAVSDCWNNAADVSSLVPPLFFLVLMTEGPPRPDKGPTNSDKITP